MASGMASWPQTHRGIRTGRLGSAAGGARQFKKVALPASVFILCVLLLAPLATSTSGLDPATLIYPACAVLTVLFAIQLWSWYRLSHSLFDPYTIFAVTAMMFNGSRAILTVFGVNSADVFGRGFSDQTNLATLYLVCLGLWSLHIGGMLGASGRVATKDRRPECRPTPPDHVRIVGWFMIAVSVVPSYVLFQGSAKAVMLSGYSGLFQRESQTSFSAAPQVLAAFLVPGALFVTAASKHKRYQLGITASLTAAYAGAQLFLGSRALAVTSIIPYVWVWHRCVKPIPKIRSMIGVGALMLVLPLVGITRSFVGENRLSPGMAMQTLSSMENPVVSLVSEMGGSAITVGYTVELVPQSRPFDYGGSYWLGILTLAPNLFWDVHPAIARGTPNDWLARTVDPYEAAHGGALGYSFIAEAYLNAGWAGVILVPGLLGFAFARLAGSVASTTDLAKMACAAAVLAATLKYARSDCTEIVRGVVWFSAIPYAMAKALRHGRPKKGRRHGPQVGRTCM